MVDSTGSDAGSCSGTLIAPKLVLTAGHCTVNAAKWSVSSTSLSKTVTASRAVTPWENFRSTWSHPNHSDIGLIVLDSEIKIDKYPSVASSPLSDGAKATRYKRSSVNSNISGSSISLESGADQGFALNYVAKVGANEWLDTGGAIIANGKIQGVVSGLGKNSGMLHIARTDQYAKWIASAAECMTGLKVQYGSGSGSGSGSGGNGWGGGSGSGSGSTSCEGAWGAGSGTKSGSGDSPWGGTGGNGGGGWGGWGGGSGGCNGGWGGYGGSGSSSVDSGTTVPGSTDGGLEDGGTGSTGTTGTTPDGTPGSTGTPDDNGNVNGGTPGSGDAPTCPPKPECVGDDCPNSDSTTPNTGSSTGTTPGTDNPGTPGSTPTGTPNTDGVPGSDVPDQCQGPQDNPDTCPPDTANCSGAGCGGCAGEEGCTDGVIDYGTTSSLGSAQQPH